MGQGGGGDTAGLGTSALHPNPVLCLLANLQGAALLHCSSSITLLYTCNSTAPNHSLHGDPKPLRQHLSPIPCAHARGQLQTTENKRLGGHGSLCRMAHGAASFQPAFSSSAQLCDAKEKICFPKMTQTHPRKPFQGTKWQRFRFLNARIQHAKKPKRHSKLRENLSCSLFSSPRPFIPKPQSDFFGWFRCPRKQRRAQGLQECSSWRAVLPWDGIWVLCACTPHPTHPL